MNARSQIIGSIAAVTLAVSFSAASVTPASYEQAGSRIVRTWNCHTNPVTAYMGVQVGVSRSKLSIATGDPSSPENLVSFSSDQPRYAVGPRCRLVSKRVVMSRNHLDLSAATHFDCAAPAHVWIRLVQTLDSSDFPVTARIEITQPHARLKPLAQLDWGNGKKPVVYSGVACASGY